MRLLVPLLLLLTGLSGCTSETPPLDCAFPAEFPYEWNQADRRGATLYGGIDCGADAWVITSPGGFDWLPGETPLFSPEGPGTYFLHPVTGSGAGWQILGLERLEVSLGDVETVTSDGADFRRELSLTGCPSEVALRAEVVSDEPPIDLSPTTDGDWVQVQLRESGTVYSDDEEVYLSQSNSVGKARCQHDWSRVVLHVDRTTPESPYHDRLIRVHVDVSAETVPGGAPIVDEWPAPLPPEYCEPPYC